MSDIDDHVDCIIAGAGAVGLAIARALALEGRSVLALERNDGFGLETSGRNSEVIHAGLYYPEGSLKAMLCRRGRDLLAGYLRDRGVAHRFCGKLIVAATSAQEDRLSAIESRSMANGVTALRRLSRREVLSLEPDLSCESAILSPETGIFDSRAYMQALLADLEAAGGILALRTEVLAVETGESSHIVETRDESGERYRLSCATFVNAAGLFSTELARCIDTRSEWRPPETRYARGTYFGASGPTPFSHLVYPVPEPGGLGIHLTLDLAGSMRFGPDVEWIDGVDYHLNDRRRDDFRAAIARYWPGIAGREIAPLYCGIRPKLSSPGEADADFVIAGPETHGTAGLVQLFGIESPGLTASLAIAERVVATV